MTANLSPDITPVGAGSITDGVIRFDRSLPGSVAEIWEKVTSRVDGGQVTYDFGDEAVDYALGWHLILDEFEGVESDVEKLREYYAGR